MNNYDVYNVMRTTRIIFKNVFAQYALHAPSKNYVMSRAVRYIYDIKWRWRYRVYTHKLITYVIVLHAAHYGHNEIKLI